MAEGSAQVVQQTRKDRWSSVDTPEQQSEQRLSNENARDKWRQIYELFGASGEREQDEVYAAWVAYIWVNGGSPLGMYQGDVKTASGISVPSGSIIKITGKTEGEIRKHLRTDMDRTFHSIKYSRQVGTNMKMRDKAEKRGIPRDYCYLLLDCLTGCEYFDSTESELYEKLSVKTIAESNARKAVSGVGTATSVNGSVESATVEDFAAQRNIPHASISGTTTSRGGRSAAY